MERPDIAGRPYTPAGRDIDTATSDAADAVWDARDRHAEANMNGNGDKRRIWSKQFIAQLVMLAGILVGFLLVTERRLATIEAGLVLHQQLDGHQPMVRRVDALGRDVAEIKGMLRAQGQQLNRYGVKLDELGRHVIPPEQR